MNGDKLQYIQARKRVDCDPDYWDTLKSWLRYTPKLTLIHGKIRNQRQNGDHTRRVGRANRLQSQLNA